MGYDDRDLLKEFDGYFEAKEPGRRERADAWATAIGLQAVDGLRPSKFLIETAKRHIEGEITQHEARNILNAYYEVKDEHDKVNPNEKECSIVSERIAAVINEAGFAFSPEYFKSIHRKLFREILPNAGEYRIINICKHEWVLKEASVTYASKDDIEALLKSDFKDEETFDYSGKSAAAIIPHFANFISYLWQRHPFREGNTRTVAVFAIKYLRSLGYEVASNMFKENSWYFRNALVRANFMGIDQNSGRTLAYLVAFFRNLLLGENNELKSRYLLIGCNRPPPTFGREVAPIPPQNGRCRKESGQKKWSEKSGQKTIDRIIELLKAHPHLSQAGMVAALGINRSAIQKHLSNLKQAGRLRRIGPDKGGHWEVLGE